MGHKESDGNGEEAGLGVGKAGLDGGLLLGNFGRDLGQPLFQHLHIAAQLVALGGLTDLNLKTARAYQIRLTFQDLYAQPSREAAEAFLKKWYFWATHSRLKPVIEAAGTIKRHWDGILRWFDSKIANGILEGINSLVQAAKAKARSYRSTRNLKAIIYLIAGKLELKLPT